MQLAAASGPAAPAKRRWAAVAAWILLIYTTLPVAPRVWRVLVQASGGAARHLGVAGLVVSGAWVLAVSAPLRRERSPGRIIGLLVVACAYAAVLTLMPLTAGERTHLLSYGVLAVLAYRALAIHRTTVRSASAAVAVVAAAGLGDELIQAVLPNRVFEWKDVVLNALSGALAAGVIVLLARRSPQREER